MYSDAHKNCTLQTLSRSKKAIEDSKKQTEGPAKDKDHSNEVVIGEFEP
jgi:hypothetical protein